MKIVLTYDSVLAMNFNSLEQLNAVKLAANTIQPFTSENINGVLVLKCEYSTMYLRAILADNSEVVNSSNYRSAY